MRKHEHKNLVDRLLTIGTAPMDDDAFARWIEAKDHLDFLDTNSAADEFVAYTIGPHGFINSAVVALEQLSPLDVDDLLYWHPGPASLRSSYVSGDDRDDVWVEKDGYFDGSETLKTAQRLIFTRTFEGARDEDRSYIELLQEFSHLTNIHWRPELRAYCKVNDEGDIDQVASMTQRGQGLDGIRLVSIARDELDQYLAATRLAIVRMFDFTYSKPDWFSGWGDGPEKIRSHGRDLHFRQMIVPGCAGYTRGFQIIYPRKGYAATRQAMRNRWSGSKPSSYVEFIAYDWRHDRVCKISTDPAATTNYFEMQNNDLPHEISPAFFKPEVLSKYKADRDKYTVETRAIRCRSTWVLRGYDVNDAGQVHAYICDLRDIPYSEQQYWFCFNEEPKAPISERAFKCDFQGEWNQHIDPLDRVKARLRKWREMDLTWWKPTAENVFDNVTTPRTGSRDEWATAFMDLSQLVIEGFQIKAIHEVLDASDIKYEEALRSIKLLERLSEGLAPEMKGKFHALQTVQRIRSKAKGHSGSSEATLLADQAIQEHGSYSEHFNHVCTEVDRELEHIFRLFA